MLRKDRIAELNHLRRDLGLIPSPLETQETIERFLPPLEKKIQAASATLAEPILTEILSLEERLGPGLGLTSFARTATAERLIQLFERSLVQRAGRQQRLGNSLGIMFHLDLLEGATATLNSAVLTGYIELGGVRRVVERFSRVEELTTGQPEGLADSLNRLFTETTKYNHARTLLNRDPTGKLLVHHIAGSERGEPNLYYMAPKRPVTNAVPQFRNAGTLLAEKAYSVVFK